MEARAELRQVRISPRKVGIVLDLIRNKPVEIAFATLKTQRTITTWTQAAFTFPKHS